MIESELDVLRDVSGRLESAGIAFMLTGSVAMNYYAQPRMTRDIDIVVELDGVRPDDFVRLFGADYYVDDRAVANAISQQSMFNLIHNDTIIKVGCIPLKRDSYRQEEFSRRKQIQLGTFRTWIVSREDLILSKLHWARDSKSEVQLRDVANPVGGDCDAAYLRSRAELLGLGGLLSEALGRDE